MFQKWVFQKHDQRCKRLARSIAPHVTPDDRVLDCGCGRMRVAHHLRKMVPVRTIGLDMLDLNETDLEFNAGDAANMPFEDQSFDVVYVAFMMHHTHSDREILKECLRVARKRVIVLEDVYDNWIELQLLKIQDWLGNVVISDEIPLPFTFRDETGWINLFQNLGASVRSVERIRPQRWLLSRHRLFVIERNGHLNRF